MLTLATSGILGNKRNDEGELNEVMHQEDK